MQRVPKQTRKVNRWNAYLHSQVQAFNKGLDPSEPRPRVHVIAKGIRERWDAMTEEERIAATADAIVELEDLRESKQAAKKESKISSTRDIRNTMDGIEAELLDLNTRTGAEVLVVQIRPEPENFNNKPRIFMTSPRVGEFFQLSTQSSVHDFAVKLQAFCIANIQPRTLSAPAPSKPSPSTPASTATPPPVITPAANMQQQVIEMKRKVKTLINDKLQECAFPVKISRINYVDFETSISERHGIVCENWPLPNFCAPGCLNSLTELEVLYHAWSTGVTTFRKMSPEEHHQFKEARVQHRLHAAIAQANAAALAAHQNTSAVQSSSAGPSETLPALPASASAPDTETAAHVQGGVPVTVPIPGDSQSAASQSASSPAEVETQLFTIPVEPPSSLPEQTPIASSSAVTLDTLGSSGGAGGATFVFSTGKRPPPSQFNILGPLGLLSKKPRKKRADAGVKRGPNKRTKQALAKATAAAAGEESPEEEEEDELVQDGAAPMMVDGQPPITEDAARQTGDSSAANQQQQHAMPDPGGTTTVFRVQAQPPMAALMLSPDDVVHPQNEAPSS